MPFLGRFNLVRLTLSIQGTRARICIRIRSTGIDSARLGIKGLGIDSWAPSKSLQIWAQAAMG
jgi:hypothetical protein